MRKLRALDLFCGGGGTCIGLQQAGFEVYGVDIEDRRHYPGHFIRGDVHHLPVDVKDFDFVWASPPCEMFVDSLNRTNRAQGKKVSDINLIPIAREVIKGHPYTCIENVEKAPIRKDLVLTGARLELPVINGWRIRRKRHFELSFFCLSPPHVVQPRGTIITITDGLNRYQSEKRKKMGLPGVPRNRERKAYMGIPLSQKMTRKEISDAVPPAYSHYIGQRAKELILKEGNGYEIKRD